MRLNKRAQNLTQPYVIILIIVLMALFTTALLNFGQDLAGMQDTPLNEESLSYIYNQSGFDYQERSEGDTQELFYSGNEETGGSAKDFTLEFQFFRESSQGFRTIFQDIWDIPSAFIGLFQLDLGGWGFVVDIFNLLIWTIVAYAIYRLLRALI